MKRSRRTGTRASVVRLAVSTALAGTALLGAAASAAADPGPDDVQPIFGSSGMSGIDPSAAADYGRSICPMLSEPGQQMADAASDVSGAIGKPMGPAPMFTGVAISMLCPMAMNSMANGQNPIPFGMFGG